MIIITSSSKIDFPLILRALYLKPPFVREASLSDIEDIVEGVVLRPLHLTTSPCGMRLICVLICQGFGNQ